MLLLQDRFLDSWPALELLSEIHFCGISASQIIGFFLNMNSIVEPVRRNSLIFGNRLRNTVLVKWAPNWRANVLYSPYLQDPYLLQMIGSGRLKTNKKLAVSYAHFFLKFRINTCTLQFSERSCVHEGHLKTPKHFQPTQVRLVIVHLKSLWFQFQWFIYLILFIRSSRAVANELTGWNKRI